MRGAGAIEGDDAFHADLTVRNGHLAFVWKGRVTSIAAQNSDRSYASLLNKKQVIKSGKTVILEWLKVGLARFGNQKYAMHKDNKVLRKTHLLDGSPVLEFMRCNPSWAGVSVFDSARGIDKVLTKSVLDTLVKKQGCSVLYSHLGKIFSVEQPFKAETRQAFELLSNYQNTGQILTATSRRLLGYCRTFETLRFTVKSIGDDTYIYLCTEYGGEDLNGLTWYVDRPDKVSLYINEEIHRNLQINPPDETGKPSVSIKWSALIFPDFQRTEYGVN